MPMLLRLSNATFCVWLLTSMPLAAQTGWRTALLIGNADYGEVQLKGATASLDLVEKTLRQHGFQVTRHENLDTNALKDASSEFLRRIPTNATALFYYVGLGASTHRQGKTYNLLRPVRQPLNNEGDYRKYALSLTNFLEQLQENSGARRSLLFIDSGYESPIRPESKELSSALKAFEGGPEAAVLLANTAQAGRPLPENDRPSTLAQALAQHIGKLDASLGDACKSIAQTLAKTTDGQQTPWAGGDLLHDDTGLGKPSSLGQLAGLREGTKAGDTYINSFGMPFHWCPPGKFTMGSEQTSSSATQDRQAVEVSLGKGFFLGEHEVTQREYSVILRKNPPVGFTQHKNAPFWGVTQVKSVQEFCKKLTDFESKDKTLPPGWEYFCPTEAQWEYACRAGSRTAYSFGDDVAQLGLHGNFADKTLHSADPGFYWSDHRSTDGFAVALAPAGSFRPNAWGLRDMHGNVAEIVADHHSPNLPGGKDPLFTLEKNGQSVLRGGAWCSSAQYCESSFRNINPGKNKLNYIGFRIGLRKK